MKLERIVQIHLAILTSLGAILLGLAQKESLMPLLVVFAAVTSVIFTDVLNWLRLNRVVANLAAVLALFVSFGDFTQANTRSQLLAVANLLVYLQIILFYQRKSQRLYWQLTMLSLLQVVVSAALNVGVEFGVLLVMYVAVAISALCFFFIHRELSRVAATATSERRGKRRPAGQPGWQRLLELRPTIKPAVSSKRLAGRIVGWALVHQIAVIGLTTLVFSLVLFFFFPRTEDATRRSLTMRARRVVGFSTELTLNELGRVLENNDTVMRVFFRDLETNAPIRVSGTPYIRGAVLTDYDREDGVAKWRQRSSWITESLQELQSQVNELTFREKRREHAGLEPAPPDLQLVRQDVILEPIDHSVLFAMFPAYRFAGTGDDVRLDPLTQQLYSRAARNDRERRELRYSLVTTGLRGGLQVDVTPHQRRDRSLWSEFYVKQELLRLSAFDAGRLPKLQEIADGIGRRQRAQGVRRAQLARALRDHFLTPGAYEYTLDFSQVQRDPRLDPIEDFVARHHQGHCEYFASALALMLRSQGIPARVVVGFHPEEYNALGGYYQVRQRHAHAWTEAYLEPGDVALELPPGSDVGANGGWLRLDPTPGSDVDRSRQVQRGLVEVATDALDYASVVWRDYILGLTATRQRETIYDPVAERADLEGWSQWMQRFSLQRGELARQIRSWLFHPWSLGVLGLLAALAVGWYVWSPREQPSPLAVGRRGYPWAKLWTVYNGQRGGAGTDREVAFYRRFETMLARWGALRAPGQTPQEFVGEVRQRLALLPDATPPWDRLAERIVAAFYRVRFGRGELAAEEASELEHALESLELQLANPSGVKA